MNSDLPLVNQNPDYLEVAAFIYVIFDLVGTYKCNLIFEQHFKSTLKGSDKHEDIKGKSDY